MELIGNSVSLLPLVDELDLDVDKFLVSTKDKYLCGVYDSRYALANDMLSCLAHGVYTDLGLKSMSTHTSGEYAFAEHSHNDLYNKLDFTYYYPKNATTDYFANSLPYDMLSIGTLFINGSLSTLCIPLSCVANYSYTSLPLSIVEPLFGEVRFVALNTVNNIDYKDNAFNGWLWLRSGSNYQYDLTAFRLSNDIRNASFVKMVNNSLFELYDACYFFKIDNTLRPLTYVKHKNILNAHSHTLKDVKIDGSANIIGLISVSNASNVYGHTMSTGNGTSSHNVKGCKYGKSPLISTLYDPNDSTKSWEEIWSNDGNRIMFDEVSISAHINSNDALQFTTTGKNIIFSAGDDNDESYPAHICMPAMVYVGKKEIN